MMMTSGIFVFIFIAALLSTTTSASGPCEKIENKKWGDSALLSCVMSSTAINSKDFLITSDRNVDVKGFHSRDNKKVEHLPKNIGEKFPNLLKLNSPNCSIKEISKDTFKGLSQLKWLYLWSNQLEKIDDDTFDFIPVVEKISLSNNKVKKLNSRAFASLARLTHVWFNGNDCINENFLNATRIAEMPRALDSKCGFTEAELSANHCGVPLKATPTILRGESFTRGDFPWMVALFRRLKSKRPIYFCGGSVISDRHVLTAAHCLEGLLPRDITAMFGAYDLDDQLEVGRAAQSPSRIFVHDHWNPRTDQFDADIAMLLMPEKIIFSTFIQPICLWESNEAPAASTGIVPGWGQSQNTSRDHETIPTMLNLPIHTNENCFLAHPNLARVSSNRTFCAGSADGRGPCFGDSGGGFYVHVGNAFYLRGIVSAAWDVTVYGECLLKMFTIYTDVVKFKDWIDSTMTSNY